MLWTYTPITHGIEAQARTTIYHCVDLLGTFPGIDATAVDRGEKALAAAGAIAIGSSRAVVEHLRRQGFERVLAWSNVADTELFAAAARPAAERDAGLVVFSGNLTAHKLDCRMLQAVLDEVPEAEVLLVGPLAEGGGGSWPALDRLRMSGARRIETLGQPDLAELLGRACVGVIPYASTAYTAGVDPLKRYEYLAAGLPVVTSGLACVDPEPGVTWCENDPHAFARRVAELLQGPSAAEITARQAVAAEHSWSGRGEQVRRLVASSGARELVG